MLEEEKIIKKAAEGEAEAFGILYDKYFNQIYRFIVLKTSDRAAAEDLTQQVFLHAWQNIEGYEHRGHPFSSWLYKIARNAVVDHYRAGKPEVDLNHALEISGAVNLTADLEKKFDLEIVQEKIKELSPDYQDVLIMRFVEELSHKEIAAALDKTEGAVKVIQHRALIQLKKLTSQNGQASQKSQIA